MMRSAAEKLSAHFAHDFSNGGQKLCDFSPTNCEVKGISFALFSHLCLFRNLNYYFMLKKSQKKRVIFRLSGTLKCLSTVDLICHCDLFFGGVATSGAWLELLSWVAACAASWCHQRVCLSSRHCYLVCDLGVVLPVFL